MPALVGDEQPHVLGVRLHALASGRVLQALDDAGDPALLGPRRQDRLDQRVVPVMGNDVEGDVGALALGGRDHLQGVLHRMRRRAVLRLDVGDLQSRRSVARGAQRLAESEVVVGVPVADMRGVQPTPAGRDVAQRNDVLGRADAARPVLEAGGEPVGALVERLVEERRHRPGLLGVGRAQLVAHHRPVHRTMPDESGHVDAERRRAQPLQVLPEALPAQLDGAVLGVPDRAVGRVLGPRDRRAAMAALADHLCGHALVDLALRPAVDQQGEVRVGVKVDEAGAHRSALELQALPRLLVGQIADACDASVLDPDVRGERLRARAVEDLATRQYQVKHRRTLVWTDGGLGRAIDRLRPARNFRRFPTATG